MEEWEEKRTKLKRAQESQPRGKVSKDVTGLEKALHHLSRRTSVWRSTLIKFIEETLEVFGGCPDADVPRVFRLLLALALDIRPNLPALTPLTLIDAVCICHRAATRRSNQWQTLLRNLFSKNLKGIEVVVLQNDETLADPREMFRDMAKALPTKLVKLLLEKKAVSYATMCSGTESPIMALEMFSAACQEVHGGNLHFEHKFLCEIDPVKQGYIYRNFGMPILFWDIQELGDKKAFTAWNALEPVPSADVVVAGTSCVDFYTLNRNKKALNEGGESGDTVEGLMKWVRAHRPLLAVSYTHLTLPTNREV